MFTHIRIPFGAKMLFNTAKLKLGVVMKDVELALDKLFTGSKEFCYDMLRQGVPE